MNAEEERAWAALNTAVSRRLLSDVGTLSPSIGAVAYSLLDNLKLLLGDEK